MKPPRYIQFLLYFIPILVLSCTEKVDIPLDQGSPTIVIEGSISNGQTNHMVRISYTQDYYDDSSPDMVRNAIVSVKDSSSIYYFAEAGPGIYLSGSFIAYPGLEYVLNVESGNQVYTASTIMPRTPNIDSISFELDDSDNNQVFVKLYAQENPLPGDYYFWGIYKDFLYQSDNITKLFHLSDVLINGSYLNGIKVQSVKANQGARVSLQMASIPKDYYNYSIAILKETIYTSGPFKPAPASLTGNISNGALGFFYAYNEDVYTDLVTGIEYR